MCRSLWMTGTTVSNPQASCGVLQAQFPRGPVMRHTPAHLTHTLVHIEKRQTLCHSIPLSLKQKTFSPFTDWIHLSHVLCFSFLGCNCWETMKLFSIIPHFMYCPVPLSFIFLPFFARPSFPISLHSKFTVLYLKSSCSKNDPHFTFNKWSFWTVSQKVLSSESFSTVLIHSMTNWMNRNWNLSFDFAKYKL